MKDDKLVYLPWAKHNFGVKSGDEPKKQGSLIEEVKAMLVSLDLKGTVRIRRGGLLEFRSVQLGSIYGRSEKEIREKAERKILQLKHEPKKKKAKPKAPLLSEFFEIHYFPYKRNQKRAENTLKRIIYNFTFIVKSGFDMRLDRYTAENVEEFLLSVPQTRKRQILQGLLNNMFRRACSKSLMKSNPCSMLESVAHEPTVGKAFSFSELKVFFENLFVSKLTSEKKLFLVFVFLTGMRRCEALSVSVADVDFKEKLLHIPGTKTELSDREIPLYPMVEKLLSKMCYAEGRYFPYCDAWGDHAFREISKKHKLHDLRHTFGTIGICCDKFDVKTVSILLGHSNVETTLKYYTHPEDLDKSLFLRGEIPESEKLEILRKKKAEIYSMIDVFLDGVPILYPKNRGKK